MWEIWAWSLGREEALEKERNGNPLQYFCLEDPMDRGATVHVVAKSWTQLERLTHTHTPTHTHTKHSKAKEQGWSGAGCQLLGQQRKAFQMVTFKSGHEEWEHANQGKDRGEGITGERHSTCKCYDAGTSFKDRTKQCGHCLESGRR